MKNLIPITVEGLKQLNKLLNDYYLKDLNERLFNDVDTDCLNHCISSDINGNKVFNEYERLITNKFILEQIDIINWNYCNLRQLELTL
jgi:hypothetical protein